MVRLRFETDLGTSIKAGVDMAAAVEKVGTSAKGSVREMNALEKAAKRLTDQNLTPQEKYNQKLELMAKAVKAGKMSMEDATTTAGRLRMKLDDAGKSGGKLFGPEMLTKVAGFTAGLAGVSRVAGLVTQSLQDLEMQAQASADAVLGSLGSYGELQQVAKSPEDYAKLVGQARGLRSRVFGQGQDAQAADLVFALRNAGYSDDDTAFITELGASRQVKPSNMQQVAEGLKKYQDIFGKEEAGDIRAIGQKVFHAAGTTQSDFSTVAKVSTLFGSEAKSLGFSDEEALAAFVAIEKASPGPEEAATRLRSFMNQVQKKDLGKGTLAETFADIQRREAAGENAFKILGESRAVAGYNILKERQGDFQSQFRDITAAQGGDAIGAQRFIKSDRVLSAADLRMKAEGDLSMTTEKMDAERENLFDTIRARQKISSRKLSGIQRWDEAIKQSVVMPVSDWLGTEDTHLRRELGQNNLKPEERSQIEDYLRRVAESNERLEKQDTSRQRPEQQDQPQQLPLGVGPPIRIAAPLEAPRPSGRQE